MSWNLVLLETSLVALCIWLVIQMSKAIRSGIADLSYTKIRRADDPGEFWLIVGVNVFFILLLVAIGVWSYEMSLVGAG